MHLKGEHMTITEFAAEAESIARDYANVTLLRDRDGAPLTNGDRECLLYLSGASLPTRTPDGHEVKWPEHLAPPLTQHCRHRREEYLLTLTDARVNPEMLEDLKRRASNLPAETSAGDYVLTFRYSDYDHDHEIGRFYDWLS